MHKYISNEPNGRPPPKVKQSDSATFGTRRAFDLLRSKKVSVSCGNIRAPTPRLTLLDIKSDISGMPH